MILFFDKYTYETNLELFITLPPGFCEPKINSPVYIPLPVVHTNCFGILGQPFS